MDWSKIKTIFILSFLVLDIYLMYEFTKIRHSSQYEFIKETSFEKRLSADEIQYVELPKNTIRDSYLSAKPKVFTVEEIEELKDTKFEGQSINIVEHTMLQSVLEDPISISEKFEPAELNNFLKNQVLSGDQYRYWSKNDTDQTITYYQQLDNKLFYKNMSGELTFYLNKDNEIISYKQTLLVEIEELSEEEKILQPIKALETLYENGLLEYGSTITKVELGYYTLVHLSYSSSQVLTPAWRFVVDDKENLFVNAFEGQIIQLNNEDKKWSE
ncbi:two-component system regulatory protein YycI [Cytobacillus sp. FJAT-54145]|uniref:Two-component system regulatory protein YycI n=1 Tax=Cytobacillus spartinae TaxID=3299023 RepID=A0ABW6KCM7_9BACI